VKNLRNIAVLRVFFTYIKDYKLFTVFSKALFTEMGATYLEKDVVSDALLPKGEKYFSP